MSAPSRWTDGAANGPREQAAAELLRAAAEVSPSSPEQLAALLQGAKARALLRSPWAWLKVPLLVSAAGGLLWLALPRPEAPAPPPTAAKTNVDVNVDVDVDGDGDGDVAGQPADAVEHAPSAVAQLEALTLGGREHRRPSTSLGENGETPVQNHALSAAPRLRLPRASAEGLGVNGGGTGPKSSQPLGLNGGETARPVTVGAAAPDTLAEEARLLSLALTQLRKGHDAPAAVQTLEEHRARFPAGLLAREVKVALAEALRAAGRTEALLTLLAQLEAEGFSTYPRGAALQLLFAQVSAEQGLCAAALQLLDGLPAEHASAAEDVRARCAGP